MNKDDIKNKLADAAINASRVPLRLVPLWVEAIGAGVFLGAVMDSKPHLKKRMAELEGKTFRFEAKDLDKGFYLRVLKGEPKVVPHYAGEPDVTMRGELKVLVDVLLGREDPDTVFFSRKLEVTGDTAAAIHLKNLLASLG